MYSCYYRVSQKMKKLTLITSAVRDMNIMEDTFSAKEGNCKNGRKCCLIFVPRMYSMVTIGRKKNLYTRIFIKKYNYVEIQSQCNPPGPFIKIALP